MSIRFKALIIEDDRITAGLLNKMLVREGYETKIAGSGIEARKIISSDPPDIILLDLGLPDMDGMKALTNLRIWSSIPVVVVSGRSDAKQKVAAFEAGADDYVTKPYDEDELAARIRTAIRHKARDMLVSHKYSVGELEINYEQYRVNVAGTDAGLTQSEFKIVALLGKNAGHVVTYEHIIRSLWGVNACGDNQILRVNMTNIRRKIEKNPSSPRYIFTEVGVGYRMATEDTLPVGD